MLSIALPYIGLFAVAIGVLFSAQSAPSAEDRFGDSTKSAASRRDDGGSRDKGGASGDTGRGGGGGAVGTMAAEATPGRGTAEGATAEERTAMAETEVVADGFPVGLRSVSYARANAAMSASFIGRCLH
ncbi:MAG TPA: hypothetical protein VKP67_17600 [Xanthobacteraceae bacterium]|nr:hypothetical protein [Xanthobacteraceae bacterium]